MDLKNNGASRDFNSGIIQGRMRPARPVFLNLFLIRQPLPAIVSILHRISGFVLFLSLPALLSLLEAVYAGESMVGYLEQRVWVRWGMGFFLAAYLYHFLAGLRFLLMDVHWGLNLKQSRLSAMAVLLAFALGLILWGALPW